MSNGSIQPQEEKLVVFSIEQESIASVQALPGPAQVELKQGKLSVAHGKIDAAGKKIGSVRGFVNSPWLFIVLPLLLGGMWLVNNTWIITNNLDKPYLLFAGPATVVSIVAIWLLVIFCKAIIVGIKKAVVSTSNYLKKPAHRFWIGTTIFLIASIIIGGQALNEINKDNDLFGLLGYAIEIAVDTTSVFSIIARQGAIRRHDLFGKRLFSFTLVLSAGFSTIANAYYTKNHYLPSDNVKGEIWTAVAFILASSIPLFIMILSVTSDYVTDQENASLDSEAFELVERERTRFFQIQLETMKERKSIEDQINALQGIVDKKALKQKKADEKKAKAERPRVPFIHLNFRKPEPIDYTKLDESLKNTYEPVLQKVTVQNQHLYDQLATLSQKIQTIESQKGADLSLISQQIQDVKGQAITASISLLDQAKKEVISSVIQEVNSRENAGHGNSKLDWDRNDKQTQNKEGDQAQNTPMNSGEKEDISKDHSTENLDDINGLDEEAKTVLRKYPFLLAEYTAGVRSMSIPEIVKATGHTPQLVNARKRDNVFNATRRKGFFSIASVISWLKTEKMPTSKDTTILAESTQGITREMEQNTTEDLGRDEGNNTPQMEEGMPRITQPLSLDMLPEYQQYNDPITEPQLVGIGD